MLWTKEDTNALIQSKQALRDEFAELHRELAELQSAYDYQLADKAYKFLPRLLESEFGLHLEEDLKRDLFKADDGHIELRLIGSAKHNAKRIVVIGECKSRFSKSDVTEFLDKKIAYIARIQSDDVFPIVVTCMKTGHDVAEFARAQGIKRVYYSYESQSNYPPSEVNDREIDCFPWQFHFRGSTVFPVCKDSV